MGKPFKQLRDAVMADPKRRASIEREEMELRQRVDRHMTQDAEAMDRPKKS